MAKKSSKSQKLPKRVTDFMFPLPWPVIVAAVAALIAIPLLYTLDTQGHLRRMERLQTHGVEAEGVITRQYVLRSGLGSEQRIAGNFRDSAGAAVDFDISLTPLNNLVLPNSSTPPLIYDPEDTSIVALSGTVITWDADSFSQRRTGDMITLETGALIVMLGGWAVYAYLRYRKYNAM